MLVIITKIDVHWDEAFYGYVPSRKIFQAGGLYTCKHHVFTSKLGDTECSPF